MSDFYMAFSVVFPICVYMAAGFLIRKAGWLDHDVFGKINKVIFKILIPLQLFFSIYHSDFSKAVNVKLMAYVVACVFAACIIAWLIIPRFVHTPQMASVMIQGIFRSNFVLFGTTIGIAICGADNIGPIAALTAIVVPLFNIMAVVLLESFRGGKVKVGTVVKGSLTNTLVIAGVLGIVASVSGIKIPALIESPLVSMGGIATPLALICLGGMLSAGSIKKHLKYIVGVDIAKMIVVPALTLTGGVLLGFRNVEIVAILAVFASPTAVVSVPMAQAMDADADLAGEIVATTSVIALLTLFVFVLALKKLGCI